MLIVKLETVTLLFVAGADPRGAPELRAASVRGALRYWLRALLGGVIGDQNWDALRTAEADVFGSTDNASPVVVRIRNGCPQTKSFSELVAKKPGISYLFFAARGTRNEPERSAIKAGSLFELVLSKRVGVEVGDQALHQAYAALWLLTHLGGLGARSRRGAGSLQVIETKGEHEGLLSRLPSLCISATNPSELLQELGNGLRRLRELAHTGAAGRVGIPSEFDVLHPCVCKVWVVDKSFDSWAEALDAIGQAMQQFRSRRNPDYQNVKQAIQGGNLSQPVQRAAFGLPIVFYYRSLGQKGILRGESHDRRASPLIIHITKLANGKYAIVLTVFYARLLSINERMKLKREGRPCIVVEPPDLNLIDEFLCDLPNRGAPLQEVTGW